MSTEKILEVGAEGGSTSFIKNTSKGDRNFIVKKSSHGMVENISSSGVEKYATLKNSILAFTAKNNPLIYFYPVYINPEYAKEIKEHVFENPISPDRENLEEYSNFTDWEEMLNDNLEKGDSVLDSEIQEFKIRPLEEVQEYRYERYADEKELQKIVTTHRGKPSSQVIKKGIGEVISDVFVIKDAEEKIIGIYPLEQYHIIPQ